MFLKYHRMPGNELSSKNKTNSKIVETSEGKANEEEVEKSTGHIIPNSILRKTILKKATGHLTVSSFDADEALTERISPFATFIQIIERKAEIVISQKSTLLLCGQSITIPAHASHIIKADGRFKMLQTVIKSGYEI
jgi:quercetin dioxygenase-like cupin family protein